MTNVFVPGGPITLRTTYTVGTIERTLVSIDVAEKHFSYRTYSSAAHADRVMKTLSRMITACLHEHRIEGGAHDGRCAWCGA